MARPNHSIDDREHLLDLLEHPGLSALLRELEALKESLGAEMLQFNIEDNELLKRKGRYDGAHKLLCDFKHRLESLKPKQKA